MLSVAAVAAFVWLNPSLVLRTAADIWIVSDPVGPADAVAVFGGGVAQRPFAAAEYYHRGLVKKILIANVRVNPAETLGAVPSETAANRAVLLRLGVPEEAIETFGTALRNTHQEALALLRWAKNAGLRSVIVPTEIFSARRVSWMLHRVFPDSTVVLVPALDPADYRRDDWWRHKQGLIGFQNEVVKYLYYRLRY